MKDLRTIAEGATFTFSANDKIAHDIMSVEKSIEHYTKQIEMHKRALENMNLVKKTIDKDDEQSMASWEYGQSATKYLLIEAQGFAKGYEYMLKELQKLKYQH